MRLPDYPVAGENLRESWGRAVVDAIRALVPLQSKDIWPQQSPHGTYYIKTPGGRQILGGTEPRKAFACVQQSANSSKVLAGDIYIHDGRTGPSIPCAASAIIELTGNYCWLSVKFGRAASAATIVSSNAQPSPESGYAIVPLVKYTMIADNQYAILDGDLKWEGDIHFDVPLRGGSGIL